MKLSLDTYGIGTDLTLDELLELLPASGYKAVEFRCESQQQHGVELALGPEERQEVRTRITNAGLDISCLSTGQRYDSPDPVVRQAAIVRTKRFVDLAADLGCGRIRVFGNDFPEGVKRSEVIRYVGESLRACGEHAEGRDVDVLLEMHGEFYHWTYALSAVEIADHPNVALNYNSDPRDLVDGSLRDTWSHVKGQIRHVHLHNLEDGAFPYKELFALLAHVAYGGYLSVELPHQGGGERRIITLYAALYREMMAQV